MRIVVGLLSSLLLTTAPVAASEAGTVHHVSRTDGACGGHAPCHGSIQAAVSAAQPGDTIQIQAGTYVEQVDVIGKNAGATTPASRILIQVDPAARVGSVVLHGAVSGCSDGQAIRIQQSRFITIRGLTITGAGGAAIALAGNGGRNLAVHIERNRIVGNGGPGCDGGITIAAGNVGTLIVNNLILANGRSGVATTDGLGGPHTLVQNTIHGNGWNGVSATRGHVVLLINNAITGNGTQAGSAGGRVGVKRESAHVPLAIGLRNNLICGNRLGEIAGLVLDRTDGGNLTPTGAEGAGVTASPGCGDPARVYRSLPGADATSTLDDDPTPAPGSPLVDGGLDPRVLVAPDLDARFEADYFDESVRPIAVAAGAPARFDIGAAEARRDVQPPTVVFQAPPAHAHLRGVATVEARATETTGMVAALALQVDGQELTAAPSPSPPAAAITATASWDTTGVADGVHTLTAAATDQDQNGSTATRTVIVDNTPPDTLITTGPPDPIAGPSATFTFAGEDGLSPAAGLAFAWRLDGGAFTPFTSATTASVPALAVGSHAFEVKARDQAGNEDETPARRTFTVSGGLQVTITEPSAGATVPAGVVLVRGTVAAGGVEVGVTVNGVVAARDGGFFAARVPVAAGPAVTLTAVVTTGSGATAAHAVAVAVSDPGANILALLVHPETGGVPLTTSFSLLGGPVPARIELDVDGDGQVDFAGPTLDGRTFDFVSPGLFFPHARVVDAQGAVFTATTVVQVLDPAALEALVQARWAALRDALARDDVAAAVAVIAEASRDAYRDQFAALAAVGALPQVAADLGAITAVKILDRAAEYELRATQRGTPYSFHVLFVIDTDGLWRLRVF